MTEPGSPPVMHPWRHRRLTPRLPWTVGGLFARAGLSAGLLAVALFTNRSFLGWGIFAIFAILVVPSGRIRSFMFSFGPYAAVWFIFTAIRSLADETVFAQTLNFATPDFEREMFGGQLPTVMLQDQLLDVDSLAWYDYLCTAVHWSYFLVPHAVAIYLWYRHPEIFRRMLGALTLLLSVGLALYFLLPSNPPWMAPEPINSPSAPVVYRVMESIGKALGGGIYEASYKVVGESNPRAAMPSIHMAITFLLVFPMWVVSRRWGIGMLIYSVMMGYSLVYLGEHYVIDILIGCAVTAYGWWGVERINRTLIVPLRAQGGDLQITDTVSPTGQVARSGACAARLAEAAR